jgi:putative hydrolase of the HAD superfamily
VGALPDPIEAVLLDAGGVLLDLDFGYVRRLIETPGFTVAETELARLEAEARREIHRHVQDGGRVSEAWRDYFHIILGRSGVPVDRQSGVIDSLWEAHQRFGLWTVAVDGAVEVVRGLRDAGFRIGVVSNAEGRVEQDLHGAGFEGLLETVVDSHVVGVEKPDPAIFEIALERLGVARERCVFVGDVPAVDLAGARAAGIAPILLDRHGIYDDADAPHIDSIRKLPALLRRGAAGVVGAEGG